MATANEDTAMRHAKPNIAPITSGRTPMAMAIALAGGLHLADAAASSALLPATSPTETMLRAEPVAALTRPDGSILRFVENCNDAGAGSLRAVAAAALPGDGIDLSALSCSEISVRTGAITLRDVALIGPGQERLKINGLGNNNRRIFNHASSGGTLEVSGLTISGGKYLSQAGEGGGCLRSNGGAVTIRNSTFSNCMVVTPAGANGDARGGAIAAYGNGNVSLLNATITGNTARTDHGTAAGGGVFARNAVAISGSRITNNAVSASGSGATMTGGGLHTNGWAWFFDSTIDGNTCGGRGGGFMAGLGGTLERTTVSNNQAVGGASGFAFLGAEGTSASIHTSTISGNLSQAFDISRSGAVYANSRDTSITNSTIANNRETTPRATGEGRGAGITFGPNVSVATLKGTIVSGNCFENASSSCFPSDISAPATTGISGSRNLIGWSNHPLPGDTILGTASRIGPLQDNGGQTLTHLPAADSPAIDAGDPAATGTDQRGLPRVVGIAADIGSVEANDAIFRNGFDY